MYVCRGPLVLNTVSNTDCVGELLCPKFNIFVLGLIDLGGFFFYLFEEPVGAIKGWR